MYRCRTGAHVSRRQEPIDEFVKAVIAEHLRTSGVELQRLESEDPRPREWRDEINALRERRAQLAVDYAEGLLDGPQVKAAGVRIDNKIDTASAELAQLTADSALAGVFDAPDPGLAFLSASVGAQRAVVDALVGVTIFPAGKKGRPKGWTDGDYYMDLSSVRIEWKGDDGE